MWATSPWAYVGHISGVADTRIPVLRSDVRGCAAVCCVRAHPRPSQPVGSSTPHHQEHPMKVVNSIGTLKKRHPDCQVVKRKGRIYVINKSNPRYKVRQGGAKKKRY